MSSDSDIKDLYEKYKLEHGKSYTEDEDKIRYDLFRKSHELIEKHNKEYEEGKQTFTVGHNKFSDMTEEEISKYRGFRP